MSDRRNIARALDEISRHLELGEGNKFKARAYANAARAVEALEIPIREFIDSGAIDRTPGIGKATGGVIREIAESGRSSYLEELRASNPEALFDLMRIPGLGARKVGLLRDKLGISTLEQLETAARAGELAKVRGFGPRAQQNILDGMATLASTGRRFLLPQALAIAADLLPRLLRLPHVLTAEVVGSVRRHLETVGGLDLCVASRRPPETTKALHSMPMLSEIEESADGIVKALAGRDVPVRLRVVAEREFPMALLFDTGSPAFVEALVARASAAGPVLGADGIRSGKKRVEIENEKAIFREIGAPFVEPELREDASYLTVRKPPRRLVRVSDLRGAFHVHTTYSDGKSPLRAMLEAARRLGHQYVGISDHSPAAYYARGLDPARLATQQAEIDGYRDEISPLVVFKGTEADILQDGSIDYGEKILSQFDFVVASVHSRFGMSREEMTERLVRAVSSPFVTFLGHLTGRLLLSRPGYQLDFAAVFDAAAANGVIIEVNGSPRRLDLDWRLMREAIDRGVTLSINPDAHSVEEMGYLTTGCMAARKGGVEAKHVFNTRPLDEVTEYLEARRKRASRKGASVL